MAQLGSRLGVTTMALYRHVDDRGDLERALVEHVLREVAENASAEPDWRSAVAGWMQALRGCWIAHPWIGSLLSTRTGLSPAWLLVLDDLALRLSGAGFSPGQVARELQRISRTTIGILLQEVSAPLPYDGLTDEGLSQLPKTAERRWRSFEKTLRRYDNDDLFDDVVAATVTRLEHSLRSV